MRVHFLEGAAADDRPAENARAFSAAIAMTNVRLSRIFLPPIFAGCAVLTCGNLLKFN
jgi:hypothetical protein